METMPIGLTPTQQALKNTVRSVCKTFSSQYWREGEGKREYPTQFVRELVTAGLLAALIPQEYGGRGWGILEAGLILEEINRAGGDAAVCHAQMYLLQTLLRYGSREQQARYLPHLARGALCLQAIGTTEVMDDAAKAAAPTPVCADGDRYIIDCRRVFISQTRPSDLMLLLARTTPRREVSHRTQGLSLFLIEIQNFMGLEIQPVRRGPHASPQMFCFDRVEVTPANLIGAEGQGFAYMQEGVNAERILIASESIGNGSWFLAKSLQYAQERTVFDQLTGANASVRFPIAKAQTAVAAADLMRLKAAALFDAGESCRAEAIMAKYLAAEAAWETANACLDCRDAYGYMFESEVARKLRRTRLYKTEPVNDYLPLATIAQHVLGMPHPTDTGNGYRRPKPLLSPASRSPVH